MNRLWVFPGIASFIFAVPVLFVSFVVLFVGGSAMWLATGQGFTEKMLEELIEFILWPFWKCFEKAGLL